jgi:hypothetical protein
MQNRISIGYKRITELISFVDVVLFLFSPFYGKGKGQRARGKGRRQNRTFTPLSVFAQQKLKVES